MRLDERTTGEKLIGILMYHWRVAEKLGVVVSVLGGGGQHFEMESQLSPRQARCLVTNPTPRQALLACTAPMSRCCRRFLSSSLSINGRSKHFREG